MLLDIAILFTIAKTWKQPKCPTMDDRKRRCEIHTHTHTHTHTQEYYSAIKKGNPAIGDNMDGP